MGVGVGIRVSVCGGGVVVVVGGGGVHIGSVNCCGGFGGYQIKHYHNNH